MCLIGLTYGVTKHFEVVPYDNLHNYGCIICALRAKKTHMSIWIMWKLRFTAFFFNIYNQKINDYLKIRKNKYALNKIALKIQSSSSNSKSHIASIEKLKAYKRKGHSELEIPKEIIELFFH